jgi:hypothetical protein
LHVLSTTSRRRLAHCLCGRQPAASSLSTPASGAADSWAFGLISG